MLCVDVNVLVYAANRESERHLESRGWLSTALASPEVVGIPDVVAAAFVRIATDSRILPSPLQPDEAFSLIDWIVQHPRASFLGSDDRTRALFRDAVSTLGLRGNDVPDAWLAASAMAVDATLVTYDRGFRRFPGLRTHEPGT